MKLIKDKIIEIEEIDEESEFMDIETETHNYIAEGLLVHNSKFSKRSLGAGFWLPGPLKENIDVVVSVDTSGSIGQQELTEFLSEIVNIGQSFNSIEITILVGDAKLQNTYVVRNGDIEKIMALKCGGGGGTSHEFVIDFIKKEKPASKCCIMLTDGFSDLNEVLPKMPGSCESIICLSEHGCDPKEIKGAGKIVKMED